MEIKIGEIVIEDEIEIGDIELDVEKVYPPLEDLEITPKGVEQNFKPTEYGFGNVKCKAVASDELSVTPAKEKQVFEGLYGRVNVEGVVGENLFVEPTIEEQYFEGLFETVLVNPIGGEYLELTPSMEEQQFDGLYVRVTLKPIEGRALTVTPKAKEQNFSDIYTSIKVKGIEIKDAGMLFYDDFRIEIMNELLNLLSPNCTSFYRMFSGCEKLTEVPQIYAGSSVYVYQMFDGWINLTNVGGIIDLGKGYLTTVSANYARYMLDVSASVNLTYESLINLGRGLYDIASKGCKPQAFKIGPENLAKLEATEEGRALLAELALKGWNVS